MNKGKKFRGFNHCEECGKGLQTDEERDLGLCSACQYKESILSSELTDKSSEDYE